MSNKINHNYKKSLKHIKEMLRL